MKTLFVLTFTSVVINGALAQSLNLGPCPKVKTVENLDIEKYSGLWYEYERSFPMIFELGGRCVTANYSGNSDGTVKVVNSQISSITGSESSITGTARINDEACNNTTCGKLIVTFPMPVIGEVDGTYWVLETDYTTYSVVWSCTDSKAVHTSFAWVLTRDRNPSEAVVKQATSLYENNNPEYIFMTKTDQENYNEIQVIHCDISEITKMESGLIGRATVNGTKLNVQYHIPIVGDKTRDIWVIDTDHDTFAVLWACTDYGFIHVAYGWTLVKKSYINRDFSAQIQTALRF